MKIAIFSDAHVHAWAEHSHDDGGVPSRLKHNLSVLQQVRAHCVVNGIKLVLFGGDLFHKRGVLYTLPYNLVVAELAQWKRAGLTLLANVGNHDSADRKGKIHSLQALESAELLRTVDDDGWANWHIEGEDGTEVVITAVSYCPDADTLRRRTDIALAMREQEKGRGVVLTIGLFHHGFRGARVGTSLEYVVKEDADADLYAKSFDWMLSGHYHAHQEIGTRGNAWYVGSPMEFVRGETSPKGFLVLDTGKLCKVKRVTLDLPRFVKLTPEQIVDEDFDMREHVKGNFVDVVFDELPMPWESIEGVLRGLGALGTRACPTQAATLPKSSRLQVDLTMGDRQLLEKYLEHIAVDPSEREDLLRVGLSLIEEATK
jgi:DNA repair exonuclease SbcCD nuclease subunit